ncbi:MAG: TetR family transcriptional regulator [Propionibacteriales bacterium]|nr:TetR family transcriptional regulator [Propionibacteriales bacterium]
MSRATRAPAGRGRRPGGPDTRGEILSSARESFASKGFEGTTIRAVAAAAGVDPALVHHYFGTKDDLFIAALELPFDPRELAPDILGGGLDGAGERLLTVFLTVWDDPDTRLPLAALLRAGATGEPAASLLRDGILRMVLAELAEVLDPAEAKVRGELVASQLLGLALARYLLALEPLASAPAEDLVTWMAPNLQRYISGDFL